MRIESIEQLNAEIREGRAEHLFMLSEAYHDRAVVNVVNGIIESGRRVVLIAGPSSSGKTTTAKKICVHLEASGIEPLYMGTDDYFIDRNLIPFNENGEQNFENLDVLDVELFNKHLNALLAGKEVDIPQYDFVRGIKRFGKRKVTLSNDQVLVIEGIHGLNDALTPDVPRNQKFKLFIAPMSTADPSVDPNDIRKLRRIVRDHAKRGWSALDTIKRWDSVIEGEKKNVFPFKDDADASFDTAYVYEPSVLKKYAYPLLEDISHDDPYYPEALRLMSILDMYVSIEDDSEIEPDSIIREFIGGSILK